MIFDSPFYWSSLCYVCFNVLRRRQHSAGTLDNQFRCSGSCLLCFNSCAVTTAISGSRLHSLCQRWYSIATSESRFLYSVSCLTSVSSALILSIVLARLLTVDVMVHYAVPLATDAMIAVIVIEHSVGHPVLVEGASLVSDNIFLRLRERLTFLQFGCRLGRCDIYIVSAFNCLNLCSVCFDSVHHC
jgi:hypothetical protein